MEAVPVGILMSGGVDSSLVTAMAVRASSQVQTFPIGFPGHGKEDETQHARLIARHFGINWGQIPIVFGLVLDALWERRPRRDKPRRPPPIAPGAGLLHFVGATPSSR
jgi:asparagine synthetase B (glutamine-hydrolysing)